jgi:hypothetical protein
MNNNSARRIRLQGKEIDIFYFLFFSILFSSCILRNISLVNPVGASLKARGLSCQWAAVIYVFTVWLHLGSLPEWRGSINGRTLDCVGVNG